MRYIHNTFISILFLRCSYEDLFSMYFALKLFIMFPPFCFFDTFDFDIIDFDFSTILHTRRLMMTCVHINRAILLSIEHILSSKLPLVP